MFKKKVAYNILAAIARYSLLGYYLKTLCFGNTSWC